MLTLDDELEFKRAFDVIDTPGASVIDVERTPDANEIHVGDTLRFFAKLSSATWLPWIEQSPSDEADAFELQIRESLEMRGIDTLPVRIQGVRSDTSSDNLVLLELLVTGIRTPGGVFLAGGLASWAQGISPNLAALAFLALVVGTASVIVTDEVGDVVEKAPQSASDIADAVKVIGVSLVVVALVYAYSRSKS